MRYLISLHGCDDTTSFEMDDLSDREVELLLRVSELSKQTSTYGCMPTMEVTEATGKEVLL